MAFYDQFSKEIQALLRQRAERAALSSLDTPEVLASIDTLVVKLGAESYGMALRALTAAYQLTAPVIPVPCTPPFVAGITNIRGHVIPVIDLAALLGLSSTGESTGVVVVENDRMTLAFRVTMIDDAILARMDDLVPVSELFDVTKSHYMQGVLPDGTIMLDMEAILNDPALTVNESVA